MSEDADGTGELLLDGPAGARATLILAHGAGAPMDSAFMNVVASGLAEAGLRVVRFEFPYMRRRRTEGRRPGPDHPPVLEACWLAVIEQVRRPEAGAGRLIIGGKSLGGRIASLVADRAGVDGLVCLGYPFHPPRRPERPRVAHLAALRTPALILQGTRDPFGSPEEIAGYALSPRIRVEYVPDGDHGFAPRARSGRTIDDNLRFAVEAVAAFSSARS